MARCLFIWLSVRLSQSCTVSKQLNDNFYCTYSRLHGERNQAVDVTTVTVLQKTLQSSSPTKSTLSAQQPPPHRHKKFPTRLATLSMNEGL